MYKLLKISLPCSLIVVGLQYVWFTDDVVDWFSSYGVRMGKGMKHNEEYFQFRIRPHLLTLFLMRFEVILVK